jgi:TRAP transporter 4TM/12TM fusion protein
MSDIKTEDLLAEIDRESAFRRLAGKAALLVSIIAIGFTLFQLYTASVGLLPARLQRAVHLGFVLVLAYLLYPIRHNRGGKTIPWYDIALALLSTAVIAYLVVNHEALIDRAGAFTPLDIAVGVVGIVLVLEACRRVVGIPILVIALVFIAYAYLGRYLPGFLNHRGYRPSRIVSHLFFTTEGILGIPLGVSSTFIFLFILFGCFLERTGIGKFFIDLADSVAGFAAGGPAKVAVITSALEGTVSGSSVSNTVGSGSFTIPMMKRLGYKPEFAAAVEASASTGGQIMPPIMGAAAFLMAETLGIPYIQVAKAAIIPALLYFTGIFISVHLEAKKLGLKGLPKSEIPTLLSVLKDRGHLILPLIAIVYFLAEGSTPMRAALWGIAFSIVASVLRKSTRMSLQSFVEALEAAGRGVVGVAIACAVAGIIVGVVTLTGLGLKMASGLVDMAGGIKILTLFFTMIASLVLGMGVPTTANYLITATITAPAVVALGVPVLAAHMFTFYFGIVADITPPVALAAYAGSAIAKSNPLKTGLTATKLAIGAFIIPYIFVYSPAMLLIDVTPLGIIQMIATSLIGMTAISACTEGWFFGKANVLERLLFLAGGLLMVDPRGITDIIGLAVLAVPIIAQLARRKILKTS